MKFRIAENKCKEELELGYKWDLQIGDVMDDGNVYWRSLLAYKDYDEAMAGLNYQITMSKKAS